MSLFWIVPIIQIAEMLFFSLPSDRITTYLLLLVIYQHLGIDLRFLEDYDS